MSRAFLKIQDGCDGYCSYCIIPKTRPYVHSKPAEEALQEAQALVEAGHKEIVVTGIFLGAYGQRSVRRRNWDSQRNDKLADLLEKMGEIPKLARIRLSSLEPTDVTPRLLDAFCKHRNIMPHLHLSLQSGSNSVLKKMCRQYTVGEFMSTVEAIKSRLDRPAITTDIIVGFPGETEADFEATVELARETGFAKMHVFSFSPRRGTVAVAMQGAVDNRVMKERSKILRSLDMELGRKFREQFVGETAQTLVENSNGQLCGRSERYFMVHLEKTGPKPERNELVKAKLVESGENGLTGQAVTREVR
ncbi:MAG: MiaB/RimO family radical SAM methylthiotransferase [Planctomycetota bacterium]